MFELVRKLLVSVADLNFFHWLMLTCLVITSIHYLYWNAVKPLLLRIGLRNRYLMAFAESMWHLSFLLLCLPMIFICSEGSVLENWVSRLDKELNHCKTHLEGYVYGMKTLYIMITAFSLHDIVNTWVKKGYKNLEFVHKQVFLSILVLTCYSWCTMFGILLYFVSNMATVVEVSSKVCVFAAQYTKSSALRIVAIFLCGLSVLIWIYTYLFIYPMFLLHNKSVNSAMMKAELNMLIVLDFLSWVYLGVSIITSCFARISLSYALPSEGRPQTLAYFLFGCDPLIAWFAHNDGCEILNDEEIFMNEAQRRLLTLKATISCRNSIMRKVTRMRAEKQRQSMMQPDSTPSTSAASTSRYSTGASTSGTARRNSGASTSRDSQHYQ